MQPIPSDPFMLLSFVNMRLRDRLATLDEFVGGADPLDRLCADLEVDRHLLEDKLAQAGFIYSPEQNKFW